MLKVTRIHRPLTPSVLVCLAIALAAGCVAGSQDSKHETSDTVQFTGKIVHLDLEGGFWGIVCDGGEKYRPMDLPADFQTDGLRVKGRLKSRPDVMGIHMWGAVVEVVDIGRKEP